LARYLYDREATKNSMDENGYFKTGDIARREGKHYFILGRASIDSKFWIPSAGLGVTHDNSH